MQKWIVRMFILFILSWHLVYSCVDLNDPSTWNGAVVRSHPWEYIITSDVVLCRNDYYLYAIYGHPIIIVENATLDCNNSHIHSVMDIVGYKGIGIEVHNGIVKNCNVSEYSTGIFGVNSVVYNNTVQYTTNAVQLVGSRGYNNFVRFSKYGISCDNCELYNNTVQPYSSYGMIVYDNCYVSHNRLNGWYDGVTHGGGIDVRGSNNVFENNVVEYVSIGTKVNGEHNSFHNDKFCFTRDWRGLNVDITSVEGNVWENVTCTNKQGDVICSHPCYFGCASFSNPFTWEGIEKKGGVYYITKNLTLCPGEVWTGRPRHFHDEGVFNIINQDIIVDCQGNIINGSPAWNPVFNIKNSNVTIINCIIQKGNRGILVFNSTLTVLRSKILFNSRSGIESFNSRLIVNDSTISDHGKYDVYCDDSSCQFFNSELSRGYDYSLYSHNSNISIDSVEMRGSGYGIYLDSSTADGKDLTIYNSRYGGLIIDDSHVNLTDVHVTSSPLWALKIKNSHGIVSDSTFIGSKYRWTVYLDNSNLSFLDNTVVNGQHGGLYILDGNNTFTGIFCGNKIKDVYVNGVNGQSFNVTCDSSYPNGICHEGCGSTSPLLYGYVIDDTGLPLPGAEIDVFETGMTYFSDEYGWYNLSFNDSGVYTFLVSKEGYYSSQETIPVFSEVSHNFTLHRPGFGFATLNVSGPVGITYHLRNDNIVDFTDVIPLNGYNLYINIPTGNYTLTWSSGVNSFGLTENEYKNIRIE